MYKAKSWLRIALIVAGGGMLAVAFQNCSLSKFGQPSSANSDSAEGQPAPQPAPAAGIAVTAITAQTMNLGVSLKIPVTISAADSYTGTLNLAVTTPELALLDTGASISFSFAPATVSLTGGVPVTAELTVTTTTMSPSFTSSVFHVVASDASDSSQTGKADVTFEVKAIYDINIEAGAGTTPPEKWSVMSGAILNFISHTEGLVVNVNNFDSNVHLVHSSGGPIPHESTTTDYPGTAIIGLPMSADGGKTVGGVYSNTVAAGTTQLVSQIYCHDHEGGGNARTLNFNMPVPINGNPNASFAYITTNLLKNNCNSCHDAGNKQGGVDLSTYTAIQGVVLKNNALDSQLYTSIEPGGNMPQGSPGSTSAALVQDVKDWINGGAPNN